MEMNLGIHRDSQYENTEITLGGELFVDVVDPVWTVENLPIDDIPLPDHLKLPCPNDDGETFVDLPEPSNVEISTWVDLNLDSFA